MEATKVFATTKRMGIGMSLSKLNICKDLVFLNEEKANDRITMSGIVVSFFFGEPIRNVCIGRFVAAGVVLGGIALLE